MYIKPEIVTSVTGVENIQKILDAMSSVMTGCYFVMDENGSMIMVAGNENIRNFLFTGDLDDKHISDVFREDMTELLIETSIAVIEYEKPIKYEYSLNIKDHDEVDGEIEVENIVWFELEVSPLDSAILGLPGVICSVRNTTDQKMADLNLKEKETVDALTKLFNRRQMMAELTHSFKCFRRYSAPVTLLLLDIDEFKNINEKYGHETGDKVLIKLSEFLLEQLRDLDIVGRVGGEEFLILMPESTLDQINPVAERLLAGIRNLEINVDGQDISFTASGGLSELKESDQSFDESLKRADMALYWSKIHGRNKVSISS